VPAGTDEGIGATMAAAGEHAHVSDRVGVHVEQLEIDVASAYRGNAEKLRSGWALTGPGGWINFAADTDATAVDADDFLAVLDGPDVHPTKTRNTTTKMAPMRKQCDVLCLPSPR
jgi:hypothetical protein